jgi:peptidoglycan/xylan/chitin deacetylase (PgdA/CDA1 family)
MKVASLLYHDVVGPEGFAASGFPGGDAAIYKLTREAFAAHVDAVSRVARPAGPIESLLAPLNQGAAPATAVVFTFDDGGVSAHDHTAPILEARGWRGIFFITTDWIGRPGFLAPSQLRALRDGGHEIGSHSCSHPPRISHLTSDQLLTEWRDSVRRLEDVLGAPVRTASVPGGYYSRRVADAASAAGVSILFNSEPTAAVRHVGDATVLGRFSIMRDDPPMLPAAFATGRLAPRLRQAALWNAKKVVKAVGGEYWLALRRTLLAGR